MRGAAGSAFARTAINNTNAENKREAGAVSARLTKRPLRVRC